MERQHEDQDRRWKGIQARLFVVAVLSLSAMMSQAGEETNKIGMTMVDIPAGSFLMGSCKLSERMKKENEKRAFLGQEPLSENCRSSDSDARDDETPQHEVSVGAFQMSKTEVTLSQFKQYIIAAGRSDLVDDDFRKYNSHGNSAPVVRVSWHDAQEFIKWLNEEEGGGYRLPSEAEWEYACRGGGYHKYCGSDRADDVAWYEDNSGERQRPVGGKKANGFGLHDMSGNVYEWVQDCWHENYNGAPTDGGPWTSGSCEVHVLRGGAWNNRARATRTANRNFSFSPDLRSNYIGLRLARSR